MASLYFFASQRKGRRKFGFFLTLGGRWFLSFTTLVGLLTLTSENNILFLLTAFLLSAVVLSSMFSDFALYRTTVTRLPRPSFAGESAPDRWEIVNHSWMPVFALEVGEFHRAEYRKFLGIAYLGPKSRRSFDGSPDVTYEARGEHLWDSLYLATSAPFGFTKKYFHQHEAGRRLIWPRRLRSDHVTVGSAAHEQGTRPAPAARSIPEYVDAELRDATWSDDWRDVHGLKADPSTGAFQVRVRRPHDRPEFFTLEFRTDDGATTRERKISRASYVLARGLRSGNGTAAGLRIIEADGTRKSFSLPREALDYLARIPERKPA